MQPELSLLGIFLTGLTTGGLSCAALQGGLLAGYLAQQQHSGVARTVFPTTTFMVAKLISHVAFGYVLGAFGSVFAPHLGVQIALQALAAVFILASALNLLEVHPIFRFAALQPPRWVGRFLFRSQHSQALFTPALLGFFTILVPCGVTQAMELLAIQSGSAMMGATIMGVFVLGTTPLFLSIGVATTRLSQQWSTRFLHVAALCLIVLSISSLNGVATTLGWPIGQHIFEQVEMAVTPPSLYAKKVQGAHTILEENTQHIVIDVKSGGYSPNYIKVKQGVPVEITLKSTGSVSCANAFVLPKFHISEQLGPNDSKVISFVPEDVGKFSFSCAMGMYTGVIEVERG